MSYLAQVTLNISPLLAFFSDVLVAKNTKIYRIVEQSKILGPLHNYPPFHNEQPK